jgi:hypothetical protein
MAAIDPTLFQSALSPQDLLDEQLLGETIDPQAGAALGAKANLQESPQQQADATLLALTTASQTQFNTEAFYGVPTSIIHTEQLVSTMVNSVATNATEYAATAQQLSAEAVLKLLAP